jgi:hypothetical protein
MIKVITLIVMLCSFGNVFAQKDLIDRLERQAVEIDSLKKVIKTKMETSLQLSKEIKKMVDTMKKLNSDFAKLEEFRLGKKMFDTIVGMKSDSIVFLKAALFEKDKQISVERQKGEQKEREKYDAGKNEILLTIANSYKNKPFDELLKSSTKLSAQRDLILVEKQLEVKKSISDIEKYFTAKELLDSKLNDLQIKNAQMNLDQIKTESILVNKLKKIIANYQTFNDGLNVTIGNIIALDSTESAGKIKLNQKKKFDKILAEVSSYIFNYDFNFSDYPYLSEIFLELFKRKQPNPDADISDLLMKL